MRVSVYIIPVTIRGTNANGPVEAKQRYAVLGVSDEDALARLRERVSATWEAVYSTAITVEYGASSDRGDVIDVTPEPVS